MRLLRMRKKTPTGASLMRNETTLVTMRSTSTTPLYMTVSVPTALVCTII